MKGEELRRKVKASGIKLADLSEKSGIPERTISQLYLKEIVEQHHLDKIEAAGVILRETAGGISDDLLKGMIETQRDYIKDLKKQLDGAEKRLGNLERQNLVLQTVIEKGLERQILKRKA